MATTYHNLVFCFLAARPRRLRMGVWQLGVGVGAPGVVCGRGRVHEAGIGQHHAAALVVAPAARTPVPAPRPRPSRPVSARGGRIPAYRTHSESAAAARGPVPAHHTRVAGHRGQVAARVLRHRVAARRPRHGVPRAGTNVSTCGCVVSASCSHRHGRRRSRRRRAGVAAGDARVAGLWAGVAQGGARVARRGADVAWRQGRVAQARVAVDGPPEGPQGAAAAVHRAARVAAGVRGAGGRQHVLRVRGRAVQVGGGGEDGAGRAGGRRALVAALCARRNGLQLYIFIGL